MGLLFCEFVLRCLCLNSAFAFSTSFGCLTKLDLIALLIYNSSIFSCSTNLNKSCGVSIIVDILSFLLGSDWSFLRVISN